MNRGDLQCIFKCNESETQSHIFENCQPIRKRLNIKSSLKIDNIYGSMTQQKEAIKIFLQIDNIRKHMKNYILHGL